MMPESTITERVKAAREGEEAAWNFLYHQYHPQLYTIALRMIKQPAMAKDAVQDVFMTAFLKLSQLQQPAGFGAWLRTILLHHVQAMNRRTQLHQYAGHLLLTDHGRLEDTLSRQLDAVVNQKYLYNAITRLPETLRTILLLRYFTAYSAYQDMAAVLGIPIGTVRSRLNQARMKLAAQWQDPPGITGDTIRTGQEWNEFYLELFTHMHREDSCKNKFIRHLNDDVAVVLPDGMKNKGRKIFESKIMDDRSYGSWMRPAKLVSSGDISIVETEHFNSAEFPHHCPASSVMVLYRNRSRVHTLKLHAAPW
jgi:RNA polymerase sigma-70 factor (ECF subfamily)